MSCHAISCHTMPCRHDMVMSRRHREKKKEKGGEGKERGIVMLDNKKE